MSERRGYCRVQGCDNKAQAAVVVVDLPGFGDGMIPVCDEHKKEISK